MNKSQYTKFHSEFCEKMKQVTASKNSDYCGESDNPFANLQMVETMGACSTEIGIITRLSDKFARLLSFLKKGTLSVSDEKIEDTLLDAANYMVLMAAVIKSKKDLTNQKEFGTIKSKKAENVDL